MENGDNRKEYLVANKELLNAIARRVDILLQRSDDEFVVAQHGIEELTIIDGGLYIDDATNPETVELSNKFKRYNETILSLAKLDVEFLKSKIIILLNTDDDMTSELEYDTALYDGAFNENLRPSHTYILGIKNSPYTKVDQISVSKISNDGLLRTTLVVAYGDGEPIDINIEYQPEDEPLQAQILDVIKDPQDVLDLHPIMLLGMYDSKELDDSINELKSRMANKGYSEADINSFVKSLNDQIHAIRVDVQFRKQTNINEPTVDELLEFISALES